MVEAMKALLCKERQEKLQLEIQLRDEICNEMVEQMQQREQWCRYQLNDSSWSVNRTRGWEIETIIDLVPQDLSPKLASQNLHSSSLFLKKCFIEI